MPPRLVSIEWLRLPEALDRAEREAFEALLTPEEVERSARFYFDRDRHQFVLGRALARTMLARALDTRPSAFPFVTNAFGCPELDPSLHPTLHFNLSHTKRMVVCGIAHDLTFGVDVEEIRTLEDLEDLARSSFADIEVRDVLATRAETRARRFFDFWTLKEAYIKARRMGVTLPLDKFGFSLDGAKIGIAFDPAMHDDGAAWEFEQLEPAAGFLVAVAVRRGEGEPVVVRYREVTTTEVAARA